MTLFEELKRRKVFKVGAAYVVVAWLVVQAASIVFPAFDAPPWILRVFILVCLLGFPIALIFAWAFEVTPEGVKTDSASQASKPVLIASIGLVALAFAWYFKGQPTVRDVESAPAAMTTTDVPADTTAVAVTSKSIAVLPFTDLSPAQDQEYFSDGISEEILNALAQIKDLKVAGRTSSFSFKGKNEDLRTMGQALGVANILEGSVRKQGDKVRITAQLIQTSNGFHLWSETYDGDLKDVFELQENIARSIAEKLEVILQGGQTQRLVQVPTKNTEAYSLYLQASQIFNRREGARFPAAAAQLEQAIRLDPGFARAYSRMAALQAVWPNYDSRISDSAAAATEKYARKAIELDGTLAEPYAALGVHYTSQRRYIEAFATLEQALAIDPNDVTANFWFATALCTTGYRKRCDETLDHVIDLDPMMPNALAWRGGDYVKSGEFAKAEALLQRSADTGLAHIGINMSELAEARGRMQDAERFLEQGYTPFADELPAGSVGKIVHGIFGDAQAQSEAMALVDRYLASNPARISAIAVHLLMVAAPQRGLAVAQDRATSNDSIVMGHLWSNPGRNLRSLPEFAEFARRAGMAQLWDKLGPPDTCRKNDKGDYVCE